MTPLSLEVISYTDTKINIQWDALIGGTFDHYQISYTPYIPRPETIASPRSVPKDFTRELELYGLDPGQEYTIKLVTVYRGVVTSDAISVTRQRLGKVLVGQN